MSKVSELQAKAAGLPEKTAAEVLKFLESIDSHSQPESKDGPPGQSVRGSFRGRLSSSEHFASVKKNEIALEK